MLENLSNVLAMLNQVEVHGERNLALLYNSIDSLKNMSMALLKNKTEEEVRANAVVASETK